MQREDLYRSSTTDMPIVSSKCPIPNKQTILNTIYSKKKNDDFFFDIFWLEIGIFSS